jgi:hypothetical protein
MTRAVLTALFCLPFAAPALAGNGAPCDSCETCTEALSKPNAKVALAGPISGGAGACIVIKGAGAELHGGRHTLKNAAVGLRIEGADAFVRHLTVQGGQQGVEITGAGATLLNVDVVEAQTGIAVLGAASTRLVRSSVRGGAVGVAFGPVSGKSCAPDARLRSPGAVLRQVQISDTLVGVAACEAAPVIVGSTITGNGVGLLQGPAPAVAGAQGGGASGPWDPCLCEPSLDDVRPGTTLFYSSGCGGCKVHEGFLPDVRARGHDVRLRENGKENRALTKAYDAYVRHCAPEIKDAIGIPGCVPNYACVADGAVAKRRGENDRLVFDARLNSADEVSEFAAKCVAAAQERVGEGTCPSHALRGSAVCNNQQDIQSARPVLGAENTCGSVKGAGDAVGCAPCGAAPTKPVKAAQAAPTKAASIKPAPAKAAPATVAEAKAPASAVATMAPLTGDADDTLTVPWWIPTGVLALAGIIGLAVLRRRA